MRHKPAHSEESASIGPEIQSRRTQLGLSQAALGRIVGLTRQSIYKIENGLRLLKHYEIPKFSDALECTPSELLGEVAVDPSQGNLSQQDMHAEQIMIQLLKRIHASQERQVEATHELSDRLEMLTKTLTRTLSVDQP